MPVYVLSVFRVIVGLECVHYFIVCHRQPPEIVSIPGQPVTKWLMSVDVTLNTKQIVNLLEFVCFVLNDTSIYSGVNISETLGQT